MRYWLITLVFLFFLTITGNARLIAASAILEEADYLVHVSGVAQKTGTSHSRRVRLSGILFKRDEKFYVITAGHMERADKGERIKSASIKTKKYRRNGYFKAKLLGIDRTCDTALLEVVDPKFRFSGNLPVFRLDIPKEKEGVVCLGHPHGRMWRAQSGKVLKQKRKYEGRASLYKNFTALIINHDCWVGGGNSGGPLVNKVGEVVGMNIFRIRSDYPNTSGAVSSKTIIDAVDNILNKLKKPS